MSTALIYYEKDGLVNCNTANTCSFEHQYKITFRKMDIIKCLPRRCGYFPLKKEQRDGVDIFLKENNMFVCLPTGFGENASHRNLPKAIIRSTFCYSLFFVFGCEKCFKNTSISLSFPLFRNSIFATCQATTYCMTLVFILSHDCGCNG